MSKFWQRPQVPTYTSGTTASCQLCSGSAGGCDGRCRQHQRLGFAEAVPKGCICPPGAEKSCQRWDCGRKSAGSYTNGGNFVGTLADANSKSPNPTPANGETE